MLTTVHIANKNPSSSFMNIGFGAFLTRYKSTYSTVEDLKVLDILSVFSLCFFWDNYTFETLCRKSIL